MTKSRKAVMLVLIYLVSMVVANLIASTFGQVGSVVNSLVFIGMDLTIRDFLHRLWEGRLLRNMGALILSSAVISYATTLAEARICVASVVAYVLSASSDTLTYWLLSNKVSFGTRVNISNCVSAIVDSFVFPAIAFEKWYWSICFLQGTAKIAGGYAALSILRKVFRYDK